MIYEYTLQPIESVLETLFIILISVSNSPFLAIVLLALIVRLATKPLERYTSRAVNGQAEIERILAPQIAVIKQQLEGSQRHKAIQRLYARYAYHPVYALRSLAGLGVQLPFFIAAFFMLSNSEQLAGVVIPVLGDLGQPDALLFGNIRLMPLVMTLVNVLALITVPGFSRKNLAQGLFISLMFLVLLYASPLGLLIYWTTSNLFSLASNFTPAIGAKLGLGSLSGHLRNSRAVRFFSEYGYLFFVSNLALLVPLLGVLGDQYNFFTAHSLPGNAIITLFLAIALLPTLILVVLRLLAKTVGFVSAFDGSVLFVFLGIFLAYTFNNVGYGIFPEKFEPYILIALSLIATVLVVVLIVRTNAIKVLSSLSLIIPLLLLHFIYVSPASALFKQSSEVSYTENSGPVETPVFLIVFDEFSGLTLQTVKGELDKERYPAFAELASHADYFPNALTVDEFTIVAVPSMLSGNLRKNIFSKEQIYLSDVGLAPGENLIEYFRSRGRVHVDSTILPANFLYTMNTNQYALASDLATLYIHIVSHKDWIEGKIGVIPEAWNDFGIFFKRESSPLGIRHHNKHVARFYDWLEHIEDAEENIQFNFLHSQFPHYPVNTTSLGRPHKNDRLLGKKLKEIKVFKAEQANLNTLYQNYLNQSSYTDKLLQDFIQKLREMKLFDKSLIIVTSDHGVSFNKNGTNRRHPVNEDSWKNVVSVPLFIKYPYQNNAKVNPSFVTTLDIAATIVKVIGEDIPWDSIGDNLADIEGVTKTRSVELVPGYKDYFDKASSLFQEVRVRKNTLFGQGSSVNTLAVNYTENPIYADMPNTALAELSTGEGSSLLVQWEGFHDPGEISFFGTIYDDDQPVNKIIMAAVVGGEIQAVFESGKARGLDGVFAFALPHGEVVPAEFTATLYEVEGDGPFVFRKIEPINKLTKIKSEFQELDNRGPYDLQASITKRHRLSSNIIGSSGLRLLTSGDDPYIVFKPISTKEISEPIIRIEVESKREIMIDLYYQTRHDPIFSESQRLSFNAQKGSSILYIKITEDDVQGAFRIDPGPAKDADVLIKSLELRY